MNIVDKNDIKKAHDFAKNLIQSGEMDSNELLLNILNKNNQLSFSCPENIGINIYEASNGEIKQIKPNKKVNNIFNNKIPKLLNNNNINNNFLDMNNKNNYMINQNQKAPTFNAFNIQNNITNNVIYNANNFDKKFSSNFTSDRGNLETVQHNVMVNNEEKNIGISYASQSKQQNFGQLINNNIININNNNHPNMNNTLKNQIIINN